MSDRIKVVVFDSHALIHRAYHALPPMSTTAGQPTNAVYGFTVMLLKALEVLKPTHVVAAFDMKGPTFRSKEYAEYKAHRKPLPDDLKSQFDLARQVVTAFNIPMLQAPGFEADDAIGTLAAQLDPKAKLVIVTGDADAFQLLDARTSIFTLRKGVTDTVLFDTAAFKEKYGFEPTLLPDYKGLAGDASDNIPGVAGIGDKSAREAVAQCGSVEDIFKHLDTLSPRLQKKLAGQEEAALFSKRLATIRRDAPVLFSLEASKLSDYKSEEVQKVFTELGFHSLVKKLSTINKQLQPDLFSARAQSQLTDDLPSNYHLADTSEKRSLLQEKISQQKTISVDTETEGLGGFSSPVIGFSVAWRGEKEIEAWYVPVTTESLKEWKEVLENTSINKVGHNIKYDFEVFQQSGITVAPLYFDTMIAAYLLNPGSRAYSLDSLASEELNGAIPIPISDLIGTGKNIKKMSEVPLPILTKYACQDVDFTLQVYEKLAPRIEEQHLESVLHDIEMPLIPVLAAIETAGVAVDVKVLHKMEKEVGKQIKELEKAIWKQAGEEFNIKSTKQLGVILFEKLKLSTHTVSRKQSGFSTAAAELDKLWDAHPIIPLLSQYRELTKLQSTYITTLPLLVDKAGRLHTSFSQTIAATGRLSSTDPNLQNIPVRTELGNTIRSAFVAAPGCVLVKADYSQLELRLAAHISQDPKMLAAFREGEDIHRATAAWVYGITPDDVTSEQRRVAKTLNFGVLYGMGPQKFARASGLSVEEAKSFIGRYREQYVGLTRLFDAIMEQGRTVGYVETLFGRRRPSGDINSRTPMLRAAAERAAFNFPMQGTEADLLKKAMIALYHKIQSDYPKATLVLTVHDELVAEVPEKEAIAFARDMQQIMQNVRTLDVPLDVDVAIGKNWRDTSPLA